MAPPHEYEAEDDFVKTSYVTRDGHVSTAYLNPHTGEGTDKHSGVEILVEWDDELISFRQTDTWEWVYDPYIQDLKKVE